MKKVSGKNAHTHEGMTLLEVLMSLAVFAILMTTAAASILGSIDANQKAQSINSVMSNMTVALEAMSRDIRVGSAYAVEAGIPNGNIAEDHLIYTDDHGVQKKISLGDIDGNGLGEITVTDLTAGGQPLALTASEVDVESLQFSIFIEEADGVTERQPAVKIKLKGKVNVQDRTATDFYLQTFVSQRLFNDE